MQRRRQTAPQTTQLEHYIAKPWSPPCTKPQEDFDTAAEDAKTLPDSTTNDNKLILYGLFKQANIGDCDTGASICSICSL